MFNVAVINGKDIIKYLVSVVVIIIIITSITRYFKNMKENINTKEISKKIENNTTHICLDDTIPGIKEINKNQDNTAEINENKKSENIFAQVLKVELGMLEISENAQKIENSNKNKENVIQNEIAEEEIKNIESISTDVSTEIVTPNPISDSYTNIFNKVKIKNETTYELTEDILSGGLQLKNKNILIFHTHTCESYTPSENYNYVQTGNYRTTDKNYSVAKVGSELQKYLNSYGYNVIHDTTYHDYPAYTGSYNRSLETVSKLLQTQEADIIIDLHRDAIGSNSNYAPTVKIGDEYAAQLMFVIGTNGGGLWHPNWKENLKFAITVQEKAEEMYPGLFKTIIVRNSRYNQHLGSAACIIEVGATGNTLDQCLVSQKYLAKVLDEVLK